MNKYILFLFAVACSVSIVSAVDISTDSYSVDSSSMGFAGSGVSTPTLEGRSTNIYEGASTGDVSSDSYSANSGWFNSLLVILEEVVDAGDNSGGGGGIVDAINSVISFISRGTWCGIGYEKIDGECVKKSDVNIEEDAGLPRQLFDIRWDLEDTSIGSVSDLVGILSFESFGTEPTPVDIEFLILDSDDNVIYESNYSITVSTEEIVRWNFVDEGVGALEFGKYVAIVNTVYNGDVSDEFKQTFRISKNPGCDILGINLGKFIFCWYWWVLIIMLISGGTVFLLLRKKKHVGPKGAPVTNNNSVQNVVLKKTVAPNKNNSALPKKKVVSSSNLVKTTKPNTQATDKSQNRINPLSAVRKGYHKLAQDIQKRQNGKSASATGAGSNE